MINSIATLSGAGIALVLNLDLTILFILALIGNVIDNIFYLIVFNKIKLYGNEERGNEKVG